MLDINKCTLNIGAEKLFKILHITDSHIALCDERDNERKMAVMKRCGDTEKKRRNFAEQLEYGEKNCDLIVHTGDLIDYITEAGVEFARETLKNEKIFFIAGNHDYSQYIGEAWEDMAYRMSSYRYMGDRGFDVNMLFSSRVFSGVNFVGIDDSYHQVEDWQTERLKTEAEKGLPIVLAMHVPLFEETLYKRAVEHSGDSAYLMGCDEKHLLPYSEFRAAEQRPSPSTLRFIEYVYSEPLIKAVLAGHIHFSFESTLENGIIQYVTGGGYNNTVREITVI